MIRQYPALDERVAWEKLENGLTVAVLPRPGFSAKMAYLVADYGAVHTEFRLDGKRRTAPAGVAHFLEHKMFELPQLDVTAQFAAMGASVNAFTSYDLTAYYFSCTEHFDDCLHLLLKFVGTPYFPDESVARELGIIDQEIGMNEDDPGSRVFENLMRGMYAKHPIRTPILGSRESIREITPQVLQLCHRAFYTPQNLMLCVAGDVDAQRVCDAARDVLGTDAPAAAEKLRDWQEPAECVQNQICDRMEVSMPVFQMAFKCEPPGFGEAAIRQEAVGDLAAEALFGESSPLYLRLYEDGLIDGSFGGGFETVDGCAILTCAGNSRDPQAVRDAVLAQSELLGRQMLPREAFERMKRSAFGRRIRDLDSFDSTCFRLCAYHFSKFDYFDFPAVYGSIQPSDIRSFLHGIAVPQRCCLSVIHPIKEELS